MILSPSDDSLNGPAGFMINTLASGMAEDYYKVNADIQELIEETSYVLNAVDLAISAPNCLDGDDDFEMMKRTWAFLGPELWKQIERAKVLALSSLSKRMVYDSIALVQTVLFVRRKTLEMNGLEVLKA